MMIKNLSHLVLILCFTLISYTVKGQNNNLECGNLLLQYTTIPHTISDKINFEKCTRNNTYSQSVEAIYLVKPEDATVVQNYFVKEYNLPKMKWIDTNCLDGVCIRSTSKYGGVNFKPHKPNQLEKGLNLYYNMSGYYDITKVPNYEKLNKDFIDKYTITITLSTEP